jgi:hypothetical protein
VLVPYIVELLNVSILHTYADRDIQYKTLFLSDVLLASSSKGNDLFHHLRLGREIIKKPLYVLDTDIECYIIFIACS